MLDDRRCAMGKSVAAYARVSTERQAESQSIEQQLTALRAYAATQGWTLVDDQIYRDEGWSGTRLDRPALDRLRDAAGRALVDVVLIASPDRLGRRSAPIDRLDIAHLLGVDPQALACPGPAATDARPYGGRTTTRVVRDSPNRCVVSMPS